MGQWDQAAIQHASALHWAEVTGRSKWVGPSLFWIYEPTFEAMKQEVFSNLNSPDPMTEGDKWMAARTIFEGDVVTGLRLADTLYMDHEIAHWLAISSRNRPAMRLERSLLPVENGFLWIDRSIQTQLDIDSEHARPLQMAITALQWSLDPSQNERNEMIGDGIDTVRIVPWVDLWVGDSEGQRMARYGGVPVGSVSWKLGKMDTLAVTTDAEERLLSADAHPDTGIRIDALLSSTLDSLTEKQQQALQWELLDLLGRVVEFFGAMLLFMNQRLLVSGREHPSRAARKHRERSNLIVNDILTIKLRKQVYLRKESGAGERDEIDWQWRWPVVGHWRKPRKDGVGPQQPIYIASYIKGPEGRPLKPANEKLYAVVR